MCAGQLSALLTSKHSRQHNEAFNTTLVTARDLQCPGGQLASRQHDEGVGDDTIYSRHCNSADVCSHLVVRGLILQELAQLASTTLLSFASVVMHSHQACCPGNRLNSSTELPVSPGKQPSTPQQHCKMMVRL